MFQSEFLLSGTRDFFEESCSRGSSQSETSCDTSKGKQVWVLRLEHQGKWEEEALGHVVFKFLNQ